MREKFLSFNQIRKREIGFKFYMKESKTLLELISVEEKWIDVAYGLFVDKRQKMITITVMNKHGDLMRECNLTSKKQGDTIYTIAHVERDWDKLDFMTVEAMEKEQKEEYKRYLESYVREGKMTELEMYKTLELKL